MNLLENKELKNIDFNNKIFFEEYYQCVFVNCNFEQQNLSGIIFEECEFIECNLSGIKLRNTTLRDIQFVNCKILGVMFNEVNSLSFSILVKNSILNFSSFYQLNLKNSEFENSKCQEVDFVESNLKNTILSNCDLTSAVFENTNLSAADLSSSYGFIIDPEQNKMNNCKISKQNLESLLLKYKLDIRD